jgi:hypothetical protein
MKVFSPSLNRFLILAVYRDSQRWRSSTISVNATGNHERRNSMRILTPCMVMAALLSLGAGTALANPAIMRKNIPGYPYPGTAAVEHFGDKAMSDAVRQENKDEAGVITNQPLGYSIQGKSLLPPPGDPKRLNPFAGAQQPSADMLRSPLKDSR